MNTLQYTLGDMLVNTALFLSIAIMVLEHHLKRVKRLKSDKRILEINLMITKLGYNETMYVGRTSDKYYPYVWNGLVYSDLNEVENYIKGYVREPHGNINFTEGTVNGVYISK
jgi:hypothetical protein